MPKPINTIINFIWILHHQIYLEFFYYVITGRAVKHSFEMLFISGNSEGFEQGVEQRFDSPQSTGELDNLIMRPELYGEPPAMESMSSGYDNRRRKRGSGTKVGGAGAATKVATKSGSGKKNLK